MQYTFITLPELAKLNPLFTYEKPAYNWLVAMLKNCRDETAGLWISTGCAPDRRALSVDYNSIPAEVKEQYSLPATYADARKLLQMTTKGNMAELDATCRERLRIKKLLPTGSCKKIARRAHVTQKTVSAWFNKGRRNNKIERVVRDMLAAAMAERKSVEAMVKELEQ